MAIQWADSFSRYGTGSTSDDRMRDGLPYNNWLSSCVDDPDPVAAANGERAILLNNGGSNNPLADNRIALPSPTAGTVGVCARYFFNAFNSGGARQAVATYATAALLPLATCHVEPNGALTIRNGRTGTVIDETISPVISTNSWNHIETAFDGTTGDMSVRVNGVEVLSGVGITLGTVAFAHPMSRIDQNIGSSVYVKDLVIWDDSGTENNTFMGSVVVRRKPPVSDVTLGGWIPSTGTTGYNLLAKTTPDDSTYLSGSDLPPAAMQFGLDDLPDDVTSVRGIVTVVRAQKVDGGDANLQTSLISNGDVDPGADRPITTAFTYYFDISELDPDTAAPWTPSSFDAATIEIDRTL